MAFFLENQVEPFRDRREAGAALAKVLSRYAKDPKVVVLGLPRGGLPVADEIAAALGAPLDSFEVRKLGTPGQEELAMGAIAGGGASYLNMDVIASCGIQPDEIERAVERERRELERREQLYHEGRPRPGLSGKTAILVDDGIATGSTMHAAVRALRSSKPARIVIAVPVAPRELVEELRREVDEVVCCAMPEVFFAVGAAYEDFAQVGDDEVRAILKHAFERQAAA